MFQRVIDYTEPICQLIDSSLDKMLTFYTFGIELYVTKNNPKNTKCSNQKTESLLQSQA